MVTKNKAVKAMETVIKYISKGMLDQHTEGTALRFINAWDDDWAEGYDKEFKFTTFEDEGTDQMVVELSIPVISYCSHHLAPIIGVCHIAYLPKNRIVGLSKLNRIVERFSRRLQVQERLTTQIADELTELLQPRGIGVQIVAEHMCISTRGVRHHGAKTITTKLTGLFLTEDGVKAEFLNTINTYGK
ncbi:MAG: GTP cyclohydrolase I [Ignisphaera sp.]|nr:GTP cyclohydrolase I [Ignisphaera sp.]